MERQIWVDGFQQAIKLAKTVEKHQWPTLKETNVYFKTDNIEVTRLVIKGSIMKRIEK